MDRRPVALRVAALAGTEASRLGGGDIGIEADIAPQRRAGGTAGAAEHALGGDGIEEGPTGRGGVARQQGFPAEDVGVGEGNGVGHGG